MKGFIAKAVGGLCLSGGMLTAVGCCPYYHNVVDTCYPERYNNMARNEVNEGMIAQIHNGHALDQTLWNAQFETGEKGPTAKLTAGGRDRLVYLVRRRPAPDTVVYIQTAQDISYDGDVDKYVKAREELNRDRVASVQKFLNAEAAGTGMNFTVLVHNPADPGIPGRKANSAVGLWYLAPPAGIVPVGVGSAGSGSGGGGGAAAAGGSF